MSGSSTEERPKAEPESVVSFRVAEHRKHLMKAAASERNLYLSEWLRRAADRELRRQMDGFREE